VSTARTAIFKLRILGTRSTNDDSPLQGHVENLLLYIPFTFIIFKDNFDPDPILRYLSTPHPDGGGAFTWPCQGLEGISVLGLTGDALRTLVPNLREFARRRQAPFYVGDRDEKQLPPPQGLKSLDLPSVSTLADELANSEEFSDVKLSW